MVENLPAMQETWVRSLGRALVGTRVGILAQLGPATGGHPGRSLFIDVIQTSCLDPCLGVM